MAAVKNNAVDVIDIEPRHLTALRSILARYLPYKNIWAYGSRVKWCAKETSDLDCVVFDATSSEIFEAQDALDESLIPFEVQLLNWETIPEYFKENVSKKYFVLRKKWEWREVILGDVTEIKTGKSNSQDAQEQGEFPLFDRSQAVKKSNRYLFDTFAIIVAGEGKDFFPRYYKGKFDLHQRVYAIFNIAKKIDNKFIYYYLLGQNKYFCSAAVGSTVMSLRLNHFKNMPILLPSFPEQKAITEVLSSLDDKIDLLHRQNKTLETIAQTLFRQWFIAEARDDWQEKPLDEIADYLNGLACQKYPAKNETEKLPVLKIKELRNGITENVDWATSKVANKYLINLGDVIFSWSGSLLVKIWNGQKCVLNQHLFKVTSQQYPKWFYYFWTKHHLNKFTGIALSKATTMGHIKREDLSSSLVLIPPSEVLFIMNDKIDPLLEKILQNYKQIRDLVNIRDVLLPKLMSGKVRVKT